MYQEAVQDFNNFFYLHPNLLLMNKLLYLIARVLNYKTASQFLETTKFRQISDAFFDHFFQNPFQSPSNLIAIRRNFLTCTSQISFGL